MSYDKVIDSNKLNTVFTTIADAIRSKTGDTDQIDINEMASKITSITVGNPEAEMALIQDINRTITSIEIPAASFGPSAFEGATSLHTVTGTTDIDFYGKRSFAGTQLTRIGDGVDTPTIEADRITIYDEAFTQTKLPSITFKARSNLSIDRSAFTNTPITNVTLSTRNDGDTYNAAIGETAFESTQVHSINIDDGVTLYLGTGAFQGTPLNTVDFSKVAYIGDFAFSDTNFSTIDLPDTVELGTGAFSHCHMLTALTTATDISDYCFEYCTALKNITIPANVNLGHYAFRGAGIVNATVDVVHIQNSVGVFSDLTDAETFIITNETGLEAFSIADSMFKGCANLYSVTMPEGCVAVGDEAFYRCESLPYASWMSSLDNIGSRAFLGCTSFSDITIKDNAVVQQGAFSYCGDLNSVTVGTGATLTNTSLLNNKIKTLTSYNQPVVNTHGSFVTDYVMICDAHADVTVDGTWRIPLFDIDDNCLDAVRAIDPIAASSIVISITGSSINEIENLYLPVDATVTADAFRGADSIVSVNCKDAVQLTIETHAFSVCPKLEKVSANTTNCIDLKSYAFNNTGVGDIQLTAGTDIIIGSECFNVADGNVSLSADTVTIENHAFSKWGIYTGENDADAEYVHKSLVQSLAIQSDKSVSIGSYAFSLSQVPEVVLKATDNISVASGSFYYCMSLKGVSLTGAETVSVGADAFCKASTISAIVSASDSVSIGGSAFYKNSIKNLQISADNSIFIGSKAFRNNPCNSTTISNAKRIDIGSYAFAYTDMQNVTINTETVYIADAAFLRSGIHSVDITTTVDPLTIGSKAFVGCAKLKTVSLTSADELTLSSYALAASAVKDVTIKAASDINIADACFAGCTELENIYFTTPTTVSISGHAFSTYSTGMSVSYMNSADDDNVYRMLYDCDKLATVVFSQADTVNIGDAAFESCDSITAVSCRGVTNLNIGDRAFSECTKLTGIPEATNISIGRRAFYNCRSLDGVFLPSSTTTVSDEAFALSSIRYVDARTMATIPTATFENSDLEYIALAPNTTIKSRALASYALSTLVIPAGTSIDGGVVAADDRRCLNKLIFCDGFSNIPANLFYSTITSSYLKEYDPETNEPIYGTRQSVQYTDAVNISTLRIPAGCTLPEFSAELPTDIGTKLDCQFNDLTTLYIDGQLSDDLLKRCPNLSTLITTTVTDLTTARRLSSLVLMDGCTTINKLPMGLAEVSVPSSVTTIKAGAFADTNITELYIPDTVKVVENGAFASRNLQALYIPASVSNITKELLAGCDSVTTLVIGSTDPTIASNAFSNMRNLSSVYICREQSLSDAVTYPWGGSDNLNAYFDCELADRSNKEVFPFGVYTSGIAEANGRYYASNDIADMYYNEKSASSYIVKENGEWCMYANDKLVYKAMDADDPSKADWHAIWDYASNQLISASVPLVVRINTCTPRVSASGMLGNISLPFKFSGEGTITLNVTGSPDISGLEYAIKRKGAGLVAADDPNNSGPFVAGQSIELEDGDELYVRNNKSTLSTSTENYVTFGITGAVTATGDISYLINKGDATSYCFYRLFEGATGLIAFNGDINCGQTRERSFAYMFKGSGITTAPRCFCSAVSGITYPQTYVGMFEDCHSLVDAGSALCMQRLDDAECMFRNCTALEVPPDINVADHLSAKEMFAGCTSLKKTPSIRTGILHATGMFRDCSELREASAIYVDNWHYSTTLNGMFENCSNLSIIRSTFTQWYGNTNNWVSGVAEYGEFYRDPALPIVRGVNYIPEKWLIKPPAIDNDKSTFSTSIRLYPGTKGTETAPIIDLTDYIWVSDRDDETGSKGTTPIFEFDEEANADKPGITVYGSTMSLTRDGKLIGAVEPHTYQGDDKYYYIKVYIEGYEQHAVSFSLRIIDSNYDVDLYCPDEIELVDYDNNDIIRATYTRQDGMRNGAPYYAGDDGTYIVASPVVSVSYVISWWVVYSLDCDHNTVPIIQSSSGYDLCNCTFDVSGNPSARYKSRTVAYFEATGFANTDYNGLYRIEGNSYFSNGRGSLNMSMTNISHAYGEGIPNAHGITWRLQDRYADNILYSKYPYTDGPLGLWMDENQQAAEGTVTALRDCLIVHYTHRYDYYLVFVASGTHNDKPLYKTVGTGPISRERAYIYYDGNTWICRSGSIDKGAVIATADKFWELDRPAEALSWTFDSSLWTEFTAFNVLGIGYAVSGPRHDDVIPESVVADYAVISFTFECTSCGDCHSKCIHKDYPTLNYVIDQPDLIRYNVSPMYYTYTLENIDDLGDQHNGAFGKRLLFDTARMDWCIAVAKDADYECEYAPLNCVTLRPQRSFSFPITGSGQSQAVNSATKSVKKPHEIEWDWLPTIGTRVGELYRVVAGYAERYDGKYVYDLTDCIQPALDCTEAIVGHSVSIRLPELASGNQYTTYELNGDSYGLSVNGNYLSGELSTSLFDSGEYKQTIKIPISVIVERFGVRWSFNRVVCALAEYGEYLATYTPPGGGMTRLLAIERVHSQETAQDAVDRMNDTVDDWNPYNVYDTELYLDSSARDKIAAYESYCSSCNYKTKKGPYYQNYYTYTYCSGGSRYANISYYYENVPSPSISAVFFNGSSCSQDENSSYCMLGASGYYESYSDAVEALGTVSGTCSCGTSAAYLDDTPDELK